MLNALIALEVLSVLTVNISGNSDLEFGREPFCYPYFSLCLSLNKFQVDAI